MAKRESREKGKQRGPWHPCDDCIDKLASALEDFAGPSSSLPKHDDLDYLSTKPSTRLLNAYADAEYERGRRWIEFCLSPANAQAFVEQVQTPLRELREWERRVASTAPPDRETDDLGEANTGYRREVLEAFLGVQDKAAYSADYLRQLAAMIRAKLTKAVNETPAPTEPEHVPKRSGGGPGIEYSVPMSLADMANRLDNMDSRKFKTLAENNWGLERRTRKTWVVRLDMMDANTRRKVETGR